MQENAGRKYKSRRQPPCDACRKRRIACVRLPDATNCSLCQTRDTSCTFTSKPSLKSGRGPGGPAKKARETPVYVQTTVGSVAGSPTNQVNSAALTERTRWITQFIGPSGDQDPFVYRHCHFDAHCYRQDDWACLRVCDDVSAPAYFSVVPDKHLDAGLAHYPRPSLDVRASIHGNNDRMLCAYLSVVHISFPLLDSLPMSGQFRRSDVLLAAMCLVAAPFTKDSPDQLRRDFTRFTTQTLNIERRFPKIETVEAALTFIQRHAVVHRTPTTPGLWPEIGTIVGMAHELGLNVDPTNWKISAEHRSRRVRIWWAAYIFDKFCAFGLGRPSYINDDNCDVPMSTLEDFDATDKSVSLSSRQQFVAMAHLSVILSEILSKFYTLTAVKRLQQTSAANILILFFTYQQKLIDFRAEHMDTIHVEAGHLDPTGTIILAYHAVEIGLCRATLRNLATDTEEYSLIKVYAKAAVEAILDLLRRLQVAQLRAYWWNPISQLNFSMCGSFIFYLCLLSTEESQINFWSGKVKEFKEAIELQDCGFKVTRLAASRMAVFTSANEGAMDLEADDASTESMKSEGELFNGSLSIELTHD